MRYRIFLYDTDQKNSYTISEINETIDTALSNKNGFGDKIHFFVTHDLATICRDFEGICRCLCNYPLDDVLCIAANESSAEKAIGAALTAAVRYDLVMYDPQTGRCFYNDYADKGTITMKLRGEQLRQTLFGAVSPVWSIVRIMTDDRFKELAYAVTLSYRRDSSIEERLWEFYRALEDLLSESERLEVGDGCYKVVSEDYTILFSVEGYKKHVYWKGSICRQEGFPLKAEVMPVGRMGADMAHRTADTFDKGEEMKDMESRMFFTEMTSIFPNPADRYVASVNFTKWQRRLPFDVRYSRSGYYGSEILFFVYDGDADYKNISVLKIKEESASFILPFIYDICPYLFDRYYAETYLPVQIWNKVTEHLEGVKKLLLHDTANKTVMRHIDSFNLYVLANNDELREMVRNAPLKLVHLKRYEIARLLDILIEWSKAQEHIIDFDKNGTVCVKGP